MFLKHLYLNANTKSINIPNNIKWIDGYLAIFNNDLEVKYYPFYDTLELNILLENCRLNKLFGKNNIHDTNNLLKYNQLNTIHKIIEQTENLNIQSTNLITYCMTNKVNSETNYGTINNLKFYCEDNVLTIKTNQSNIEEKCCTFTQRKKIYSKFCGILQYDINDNKNNIDNNLSQDPITIS